MNYINCSETLSAVEMRAAIAFWSENSYQHIESLLTSPGAPLIRPPLTEAFKVCLAAFKKINALYRDESKRSLPTKPDFFFKENRKLIALLERLKFEGFGGYPELQQDVFHYIYEQRYINAVFGIADNSLPVLINLRFAPFGGYRFICIYNQMYFWSIIGAMHPSLLLASPRFQKAVTAGAREFLMDITNQFGAVCFELTCLERPLTKKELLKIFEKFNRLNSKMLGFLQQAKSNSTRVYESAAGNDLPASFYSKLRHMIAEHTLVSGFNERISVQLSAQK